MAAPLLLVEKLRQTITNTFFRSKSAFKLFNSNSILRHQNCLHFTQSRNVLFKLRIAPVENTTKTNFAKSTKIEAIAKLKQSQRLPPSAYKKVVFVAVSTVSFFSLIKVLRDGFKLLAEESERPYCKPSRQVLVPTDESGLKLTLYQFQTCPFCCKVRAALDYYGFSYDVIEVNSVTKKQLKWNDYQKVPVLIVGFNGEKKREVHLKDSSVIISVLESYLQDPNASIEKLNSYYPCLTEKEGKKVKYNYQNKYFIMFPVTQDSLTQDERSEERKWRQWADDHLVHMLSPNAYRTAREALQSFNYFSEVGEWEKNFTTFERYTVIYVGAAVMYVMGKILKKKYNLNDDVRVSLYDACNDWVKAVGKKRQFMGGDKPNLADLAVYGVLNSIEGCAAFQDALKNTKIGPWYRLVKESVKNHEGVPKSSALSSN